MNINTAIITRAKANEKAKEKLYEEQKQRIDKERERASKEYSRIRDQIWKIEAAQRRADNKSEKIIERFQNDYNKRVAKLHPEIATYERVMDLLSTMYEDAGEPLDFEIRKSYRQEHEPTPEQTLWDNEFLKLQWFIVENDRKPKNKYALVLCGRSLFNKKFLELPYSYGCPLNVSGANILVTVREAPNEEELHAWLIKHELYVQGMDWFIAQKKAEQDYLDVKEHCTAKAWRIAYLKEKKYYYEECYSHGTETPEYKAIMAELKKARA